MEKLIFQLWTNRWLQILAFFLSLDTSNRRDASDFQFDFLVTKLQKEHASSRELCMCNVRTTIHRRHAHWHLNIFELHCIIIIHKLWCIIEQCPQGLCVFISCTLWIFTLWTDKVPQWDARITFKVFDPIYVVSVYNLLRIIQLWIRSWILLVFYYSNLTDKVIKNRNCQDGQIKNDLFRVFSFGPSTLVPQKSFWKKFDCQMASWGAFTISMGHGVNIITSIICSIMDILISCKFDRSSFRGYVVQTTHMYNTVYLLVIELRKHHGSNIKCWYPRLVR